MTTDDGVHRAVALFGRVGYVLVATAGRDGRPHLASAVGMERSGDCRVAVVAWFCPGTLENLGENPRISLTVWDPDTDEGHQLGGRVEEITELDMMDGLGGGEPDTPIPQVRRRFVVSVEAVTAFTRAPHSDVAEGISPGCGPARPGTP